MRYVSFRTFYHRGLLVELCTLKRGCALIYRHAMWRWIETDFGMSPDSKFQTHLPASQRERTPPVSTINYVSHPLVQLMCY